jgi:NMD protein affecting ribosome stability and mRNA decay
MKLQELRTLIREEIKRIKEDHQPGDIVLYKGTRYEVVEEGKYIITLKNLETGKIINLNYNQFKNQSQIINK